MFYALIKHRFFSDQSERTQGPIYIIKSKLCMGFRAVLNFSKFSKITASSPMIFDWAILQFNNSFLRRKKNEKNLIRYQSRSPSRCSPWPTAKKTRPLWDDKGNNRLLLRSLHLLCTPGMVAPRVSRLPTAGQGERRLWKRARFVMV